MLVKCPQCSALLEAAPGAEASCRECGFAGAVSGERKIHARAQEIIAPKRVERNDLWAPFAVLAGIGAVATFYLSGFVLPFLLAAAAIGLGLLARARTRASSQATFGIALGATALVLQLVALAWG